MRHLVSLLARVETKNVFRELPACSWFLVSEAEQWPIVPTWNRLEPLSLISLEMTCKRSSTRWTTIPKVELRSFSQCWNYSSFLRRSCPSRSSLSHTRENPQRPHNEQLLGATITKPPGASTSDSSKYATNMMFLYQEDKAHSVTASSAFSFWW